MSADNLRLTAVPTVAVGMGIRRPPTDVFQAFVDPAITTRFWLADSTGPLTEGATVVWELPAEGVSAELVVQDVVQPARILFEWGSGVQFTTVELTFEPWGHDATYVHIAESGLSGSGDELAARAADSTGGFTMVLCSLKALLEHDIRLNAIADRAPDL